MLRKVFGVAVIAAVATLVGLNIVWSLEKNIEKPNGDLVSLVRTKIPADDEITNNAMSELHMELKDYLAAGQDVEDYWDAFYDNPLLGERSLNALINSAGAEIIAIDIRKVKELVEIAKRKQSNKAIRYAYKIVSDLDYWLFNPGMEDQAYWGATETLQGDGNKTLVNRITKFIETNS